jgi:uridine phosphorylase
MLTGEDDMPIEEHPPLFDLGGQSLMAGVDKENVGRYVILSVRDPLGYKVDVAEEIAGNFDDARLVADTKMFVTYSGTYRGVPVTVCSTGSGAPETEIALTEFLRFTDADTFIRVGTSGTYQEHVGIGDIVIAAAAVRDDGTSAEYVKQTYPAFADYQVIAALVQSAHMNGYPYHVGITRSNDSSQVGQGRPVLEYWQDGHKQIPGYWRMAGIKNFERETSIIYVMCSLLGKRAASVNAVVNSMATGEIQPGAGAHESIAVVLDGIKLLDDWDHAMEAKKATHWFPGLMIDDE